jgi:transposase
VQVNDLSRSLAAFDPISPLVVVVEMSKMSWLVSGVVPGVERQPLKKLEPDATALLRLIERWRSEAVRAGRPIRRIAVAYEAGRDGFWLARWLIARGIEAHVIHSASVAVSRERKRAKTDRLDAAILRRVFLGWLRGERGHCGMVAIPTMEEEDARRPSRERESLVNERSRIVNRMKSALARLGIRGFKPHLRRAPERLACLRTAEGTGLPANIIEELRRDMARLALVREQISSIEKARAKRLERAPDTGPHAMVRLLSRVIGIGIETADMLVREILSRKLRDRRAVARYAGLTGSPDESGLKSREKGLAKAGNARVRRGLIQFDPALAESGRVGRWKGASERRRDTARRIDQRAVEQPLSPLCARPLVRARGEEPVAGRSPTGALRRRLCDLLPISIGRHPCSGRATPSVGKVRPRS